MGYDGKKGTYNGQEVFCPVNDWDCPYCKRGKKCCIENGDPIEDCDSFAALFESWNEWEES